MKCYDMKFEKLKHGHQVTSLIKRINVPLKLIDCKDILITISKTTYFDHDRFLSLLYRSKSG